MAWPSGIMVGALLVMVPSLLFMVCLIYQYWSEDV